MAKKDLNKIGEIKQGIKEAISVSPDGKNSFDKDFYRDVDRLRNNGCCTLPFLIALLVIVFAVIIIGLIYFKNYTKLGIDYLAKSNPLNQTDLREGFIEQTKQIQPGETAVLEFTEIQISQYLGLSDPDFPIRKARLHIDNKGVVINGKLSDSFLSLPIEICLRPKIDHGKLIFVLDDVAASSISLPKFAKDKINDYLDLIMRSKELYDPNLEIISTYTADKILRVEIQRKM